MGHSNVSYQPLRHNLTLFIPAKPLLFSHTNSTVFAEFNAKSALSSIEFLKHKAIECNALAAKLNLLNNSKIHPIVEDILLVLEDTSKLTLNTLDLMPHAIDCPLKPKKQRLKRQVMQPTGLFPFLGKALSILTGIPSPQVQQVINSNTDNIMLLKKSQTNMVQIVNSTLTFQKMNTKAIFQLEADVQSIEIKINSKLRDIDYTQQLMLVLDDLLASAGRLKSQMSDLTNTWFDASNHQISKLLITKDLLKATKNSLNDLTNNLHNKLYVISKIAAVDVIACDLHVWLSIRIPLITSQAYPAYSVKSTPVKMNNTYVALDNEYTWIAYSESGIFQLDNNYEDKLIKLNHFSLCAHTIVKQPLAGNCLYSIISSLTGDDCRYKTIKNPQPFQVLDSNNVFYYYVLSPQIANLKCVNKPTSTRKLSDSGIIMIPHGCVLFVGTTRFSNMGPNRQNTFNQNITIKFSNWGLTEPEKLNLTLHSSIKQINEQNKIRETEEIIANIKNTPVILTFSYVSSGVSILLLITVLILAIKFCGFNSLVCPCKPRVTKRVRTSSI